MSILSIPDSYQLPWADADYFCIPTGHDVAGGTGTRLDPFVGLKQLRDAMNTTPGMGAIRVGYDVDLGNQVSLTSGASTYTWASKGGLILTAWREDGDPATPSRAYFSKLIGTSAAEWEEVSISGVPGAVIATNNVYATPSSTSNVWHYTGSITNNIIGVSYGTRDSIEALGIVTTSTYRQHTYNSQHVQVNCLERSGTNAIVYEQEAGFVAMTEDMQWNATEGAGGLIVFSDANPATRWGGVYVQTINMGVFEFRECDDIEWHYALQMYGGKALAIRNNGPDPISAEITGLGFEHCGPGISWITDQGCPTDIGSEGAGSIRMSAGTNATVFGDGTTPWIDINVRDVIFRYQYGRMINASQWFRNGTIENVRGSVANIQEYGFAFFGNCMASYTNRNTLKNWRVSHISTGIGEFRTDLAIDCDGACDGMAFENLIVTDSYAPFQFSGSRGWQLSIRNSQFLRVVHGIDLSDGPNDGCGAHKVANVLIELEDPALWGISALGLSGGVDFSKAIAITMVSDTGFPPAGAAADTDVQSDQDGMVIDNVIITNPNAVVEAYGFRNATIGATNIEGPWHAVGGVGTVANNGYTVPLNQQQIRDVKLATIGTICMSGIAAGKRVVDRLYADAILDQTIGTLITDDPLIDANGFLSDSSPAAVRTGGTVLDQVTVNTDVDYTRVAHNENDMRYIPRYNASLGPNQWIALSDTTRALFNAAAVAVGIGLSGGVGNSVGVAQASIIGTGVSSGAGSAVGIGEGVGGAGGGGALLTNWSALIAQPGVTMSWAMEDETDLYNWVHSSHQSSISFDPDQAVIPGCGSAKITRPASAGSQSLNIRRWLDDNMDFFGPGTPHPDHLCIVWWYRQDAAKTSHISVLSSGGVGTGTQGSPKLLIIGGHDTTEMRNPLNLSTTYNLVGYNGFGSSNSTSFIVENKHQKNYISLYRHIDGSNPPIAWDHIMQNHPLGDPGPEPDNECFYGYSHWDTQLYGPALPTPPAVNAGDDRNSQHRAWCVRYGPTTFPLGSSYSNPIEGSERADLEDPYPDPVSISGVGRQQLPHIKADYTMAFKLLIDYAPTWTSTAHRCRLWVMRPDVDDNWVLIQNYTGWDFGTPETPSGGTPAAINGGVLTNYHSTVWLSTFLTNGVSEVGRPTEHMWFCGMIAGDRDLPLAPSYMPGWVPAPGEWGEISAAGAVAQDIDPDPDHSEYYNGVEGFGGSMADWCGGVFIASKGELGKLIIPASGGHAGYNGMMTYAYDVATREWEVIRAPLTPEVATGSTPNGQHVDGATGLMWQPGAPTTKSSYLKGHHNYGNLAYDSARDRIWSGWPGDAPDEWYTPTLSVPGVLWMDPDTGVWTFAGTDASGASHPQDMALIYSADHDSLFRATCNAQSLAAYNIGAGTYSRTTGAGAPLYDRVRGAAVDEVRKLALIHATGSVNKMILWNLNADDGHPGQSANRADVIWSGSAPAWISNGRGSLIWCSADGCFYAWGYQYSTAAERKRIWKITPPAGNNWAEWKAGAWTATSIAGGGVTPTEPQALGNGTYGRLFYAPKIRCICVVNATNQPVYGYRIY